jgi:hypothetical protein
VDGGHCSLWEQAHEVTKICYGTGKSGYFDSDYCQAPPLQLCADYVGGIPVVQFLNAKFYVVFDEIPNVLNKRRQFQF